MEKKDEKPIPCVACRSYDAKQGTFSCKPHECKELSTWLLKQAPQLRPDALEFGVQLPSIPYVV